MTSSLKDYIHVMCEPVVSGRQPANLMLLDRDSLEDALRLIAAEGLKAHVHVDDHGVASVYLYLDDHLEGALRDLSSIGFDQADYYRRAVEVLGIDAAAVNQWSANHAPDYHG